MDVADKLEILADAAKYDVACTSSGINRGAQKGKLGNALSAGCCHSFTADGRCISLLKVLMTNVCVYDCAYCANRASNEVKRAAFTPQELADLTIAFYRRNYIEGLFLSSGVIRNPDFTSELMLQTLRILRDDYGFNGYIHAKAVPGTSPELIDQLGRLADRMSVNLELPSHQSLALLAPQKSAQHLLAPMRQIRDNIADTSETRSYVRRKNTFYAQAQPKRKARAYVPAGQSTQMIIGASPESDFQILNLSSALYRSLSLKRVFFSAYLPVNEDARLPSSGALQLNREHRLYQADWLMRFYRFDVSEIIDQKNPFLDTEVDPKANWALNHLDLFPVEVNTCSFDMLLRVPGIGVTGAKAIVKARRSTTLGESELRKLGIAYKRARFFITSNGRYAGHGVDFSREGIRAHLAAPIDGGKHGRRAGKITPGQMSLFDDVEAAERLTGAAASRQLPPAMSQQDRAALHAALGALGSSARQRHDLRQEACPASPGNPGNPGAPALGNAYAAATVPQAAAMSRAAAMPQAAAASYGAPMSRAVSVLGADTAKHGWEQQMRAAL